MKRTSGKISGKIASITTYSIILLSLIGIFAVALAGCTQNPTGPNNPGANNNQNTGTVSLSGNYSDTQQLKKFNSDAELQDFIMQTSQSVNTLSYGGAIRNMITEVAPTASKSTGTVQSDAGAGTAGATDYSQTNVQVQGVDEPDFVKNDARYIYTVSGNYLLIIDALDAKNAKIISNISFASPDYSAPQPKELFVNKDKLILFLQGNVQSYYFPKYSIQPQQTYKPVTVVQIYDISDRSDPKLEKSYSISGNYYDARMIDNFVYVVSQDYPNPIYFEPPIVMAGADIAMKPAVYYFDNPDTNYEFNTITSVNIDDNSIVDSKSFLLGYSDTLMVSKDNMYIAYQKNSNWCFGWRCGYDTSDKDRFSTAVVPLLQGQLKTDITAILAKDTTDDEKWTEISGKLSQFYTALQNDDNLQQQYKPMFDKIQKALDEYDAKKALENQKTVIQKFGITNGNIEFKAKAEVDGRLLNQFSMDEYNGNLRVATTVNIWVNGNINYNNVYVLDNNMQQIGSLQNLAKNESITSTRFVNDKLYMVTFRQVDPFFVIDLSNPSSPQELGYLKIPGYSTYLQPYKNFIIGIGQETSTNDNGGTTINGLKVSMFDVSDFNNPKEVSHYDIGSPGTDSPALHDHKALLISETKNIMVLPVTEITQEQQSQYSYNYAVWDGAYVFNLSDSGFSLMGKVKHSSEDTSYYNWWNQASVLRSLYMDNNLYTISDKYIKINDLANNLDALNTITLPSTQYDYGIIYPMNVGGGVAQGAAGQTVGVPNVTP